MKNKTGFILILSLTIMLLAMPFTAFAAEDESPPSLQPAEADEEPPALNAADSDEEPPSLNAADGDEEPPSLNAADADNDGPPSIEGLPPANSTTTTTTTTVPDGTGSSSSSSSGGGGGGSGNKSGIVPKGDVSVPSVPDGTQTGVEKSGVPTSSTTTNKPSGTILSKTGPEMLGMLAPGIMLSTSYFFYRRRKNY